MRRWNEIKEATEDKISRLRSGGIPDRGINHSDPCDREKGLTFARPDCVSIMRPCIRTRIPGRGDPTNPGDCQIAINSARPSTGVHDGSLDTVLAPGALPDMGVRGDNCVSIVANCILWPAPGWRTPCEFLRPPVKISEDMLERARLDPAEWPGTFPLPRGGLLPLVRGTGLPGTDGDSTSCWILMIRFAS